MAVYREITLIEKSNSGFANHQREHARNKITRGRTSRRDPYDALCIRLEWLVRKLFSRYNPGGARFLWRERVLSYIDLSKGRRNQRFKELDGVVGDEEPLFILELKTSISPSLHKATHQASKAREILTHRWSELFVAGVWIDTACLLEGEREEETIPATTIPELSRDLFESSREVCEDVGARLMLEEVLACCEEAALIESAQQVLTEASLALAQRRQNIPRQDPLLSYEEEGFGSDNPFATLSLETSTAAQER